MDPGASNPLVDEYIEGAELWPDELAAVRSILLGRGLTEELKWRKPCYSHEAQNVVILQEMKAFLALMFFKGALLADPDGVLEEQGPNSRAARRITVASVGDVHRLAGTIAAYVDEAMTIAVEGRDVPPAPQLVLVAELQERLDDDPPLRAAFDALTPGRQREYNLHVSNAKRPETRAARVEKHVARILAGKGLRD